MNEIIYLEPDEEITSVIDRLKKSETAFLALVIPRGATLAQSIVNLKLLKKSAEKLGKEISLVANDRISRNLASQIGLTVFSKVAEAKRSKPTFNKKETEKKEDEDEEEKIEDKTKEEEKEPAEGDFKVNNYYRNKSTDEEPEETGEIEESEEEHGIDPEEDEMEETEKIDQNPPAGGEGDESIKASLFRSKNIHGSRKPIIVICIACLVLLSVVSFVFLPYASASVQIKTSDYEIEKDVIAEKDAKEINANKLTLPSQLVEVEKEKSSSYDSTGQKDMGEKAKGTVTIYNAFSSQSALSLVAGTTLSSGGKEFVLDANISIPKAVPSLVQGTIITNPGSAEASVTAVESGDSSNLPPATFAVASYASSKVYAESKSAFTGGVSKVVKIVTDKDLTKAEEELKKTALSEAKTELIKKAADSNLSISESDIKDEIVTKSSDKKANDEADKFTYTIKIKVNSLGFLDQDLSKLMKDSTLAKLESDKMLVNPEKSIISYKITSSDSDLGIIKIKAKLTGKIGQKIDEDKITNSIMNKSKSKAIEVTAGNDQIEKINISIWPSFYNRTPILKNRIKVEFVYSN